MVSTSKILTVSYGTFSCTLEGFDDSFDTMKAIAEYFRDLAADDRYFGAEPPTPDAEMLARIAEREIARRVEAHEDQGKIVLRAQDAAAIGAASDLVEDAPKPAEPSGEAPELDAPDTDDVIAAAVTEDAAPMGRAATEEMPPANDNVAEDHPVEIATIDDAIAVEDEVPTMDDMDDVTAKADDAEVEDVSSMDEIAEQPGTSETDPNAELGINTEATDFEDEISAEVEPEPDGEEFAAAAYDDADGEDGTIDADIHADVAEPAEAQIEDAHEVDLGSAVEADDVDETPLADAEAFFADTGDAQDMPRVEAPATDDAEDDDGDSVAARLSRIRSVVSQTDLDYEVSEYSEDEHATDALTDPSGELDALLSAARDDLEDDAPDASVDAEALAEDTINAILDQVSDAEVEVGETIEAREQAFETEEEISYEAHEDDAVGPVEPVDEDTLSQLLEDAAAPTQDATQDIPEIAENLDVDLDDDLNHDEDAPDSLFADLDDALDAEAEAAAPLVLGDETRVEVAEDDDETPGDAAERPLNARVVKMKRADFEAAIAHGVIEEDDDAVEGAALSPEDEADLQRELAEVEAELDGGETEQVDAAALAEDVPAEPMPETAEDVADALDAVQDAEFVDVEAEEPKRVDAPETRDGDDLRGALSSDEPAEDAVEKPRRGLSRLLGMGKREPVDEERIFDEADNQMGDEDVSMRRTAIQHLRAAVAATRAEKKAGVDVDKGVDETPYRSDLAEVVRPRRPTAAPTTRSTRPSDQRPAPLKLVAEQRVDTERAPVRPRRVSASDMPEAAESAEGGFTAFAEEMGASELSDLLEAAAAYMSDVEGRAEFSRPMLMGKLKEVKSDSYSREDGLRSFGQLLREGKLRKLKGGRFAVTEETEYRSETRNAS